MRVLRGEMRQPLPWHDRSKPSSIRPDACGDGGNDLIVGPIAKPCLLVRREIAADEGAEAWNGKSDIGARERGEKSGLPRK